MEIFDIAVIGAGSAGCALAGRLAEQTDLRIALIEGGADYGRRTSGRWPADLLDAHYTPDSHDWGFDQSRARVIGGCSVHNECALVRALPGDYSRWDIPGWSDADLAPIVADVAGRIPTQICRDEELATWQHAFLDTAIDAGFSRSDVSPFTQNIKNGIRWNAAFAFLDPVRSKVKVISNILVDRLIIERDRAEVLIGHGPNGPIEVRAERFVLCAGVYGSPAILLRSGIGLRGIGANLHDHPGVALEYQPTRQALRAVKTDAATGRFYQAQVALKKEPDLRIVPYQTKEDGEWSFSILAYYLSPRSRGRMRIKSRDPAEPPSIDLGLLDDARDVAPLVDAVQIVHELTRQSPLAEAIKSGPRRFTSRKRLASFVRENVTDYAHAVGTCRMGDVIDAHGRVEGLSNVFVADASIIPQIPRANTNFTCFVIGMRVADFLRTARP